MTMNPKVKKFRIRRSGDGAAAPGMASARAASAPVDDGFGPEPFPTAEQDMLTAPPDRPAGTRPAGAPAPARPAATAAAAQGAVAGPTDADAVRAEGLTARQLRLARRVADKHGIVAASDHDAVAKLRKRGIDPFQRSSVLELVIADARSGEGPQQDPDPSVRLPQTTRQSPNLPGAPIFDDSRRQAEIARMQADLARRRRRKTLMLFARLAVFVLLPALIAGFYYYRIATPSYATRSEFVIQQAEPAAAAAGMGSLLRGTQFATSQDSITVQSYLQSRDAMMRLDRDLGFKAHFSREGIDPLQRLDSGATNEAAYKLYSRNVKISYDPTEGIVKMEVIAMDPQVSEKFSRALIGYAEEQVDHLTQRLREDQMKGARESYQDAENKVAAAQNRVLDLQQQLGVLDPVVESNVVMSQVGQLESQLQQKRLSLQQLLDNTQPNQARVDGVRGDIQRLEDAVATLRAGLTSGNGTSESLAAVTGQLRIAEADLQTRQLMLSQAMQSVETSRIDANRQVRYLSIGVAPVAPDEPTYPRRFENTVLALLVFSGIYLMMSLTASILREQVTA